MIVVARASAATIGSTHCAMMQILAAIRRVDRIIEGGIDGMLEPDILVDAAGNDMAVAVLPRAAVPGGAVAVPRSHIKIVAVPHDPDRHRLALCAVAPRRDDL